MKRNFDRRAKTLGLTRARWQVLWHLNREQGLKQATLAERMDVAPISLTRQIDLLEAEKLVERRRDDSDRRCFRIYLTPEAEPALAQLRGMADLTRAEALAGFSQEEEQLLQDLLSRMRANLSGEENNGEQS
ncbi:MarR family transcriptional regulator [Seongchinamella sediminis]|uniref:MarR family transcriptional regulator n=2 Tax=Seongchinamella sediminis TaxID=2283635 RepID=A0A3L7DV38_9GAMM|nr:MarR family transcriptional regulator [Seongchinamella sediminis]